MTSSLWAQVALGSYCSKVGSGSTPRGGDSVYVEAGTAFVRSQNVYNGEFSYGLRTIGASLIGRLTIAARAARTMSAYHIQV